MLRPLMRSSYQNGECIREQIRDTYEPISFYTSSESSSEIRCCNHEGKYFHQKFGFVSSPSDDQCNQERIMLWVSVMMTRIIEITENKIQFREVDQKTAPGLSYKLDEYHISCLAVFYLKIYTILP